MKSSSLSSPTLSPLSQVNTDADEVQEEADPQFGISDALQNDTGRPKAMCTVQLLHLKEKWALI